MSTNPYAAFCRINPATAARAFVRVLIATNGVEIVETVAVGGRDDAGRVLPVATGEVLGTVGEPVGGG